MVAQGIRKDLFPISNPSMFAAMMAAFVNERETDDESIEASMAPKILFKTFEKINNGLKSFASEMESNGFQTPRLFLLPAVTLFLWARGLAWEKVLAISKMAEGDLAMLILRTADNLRHIRNIGSVFPDAARTSGKAIDLILREPVVSTCEV